MFFPKAVFCRAFQLAFRAALPILPYREPKIIDSCARVPEILALEGAKKPLIVTDPGIIANKLLDPLTAALEDTRRPSEENPYAVFGETQPNPSVDNVEAALALYHREQCDSIIAIGGGSALDCAKALGARVAYPKKTIGQMRGILRVLRKLPLLIAIPTTAGTGSEVTLAAVITDTENHDKYALMSFPLIPHYAVLDAKLTYSLPPNLTASTGMDALTHAVEAYIGRSTTAKTRKWALEATKLVFENVEAAYSNGTNHIARENILHAAYTAGAAFSQSYVGYIHAIAHSLGGQYGTPHGLTNAVIMPYVLEAYGTSAHRKLHELGIAAGVCNPDDTATIGARTFIEAIRTLNANMGIPDKLPGILEGDIPAMARHAEREANPLYPVPKLMTQSELAHLYYDIADWSSR